MAKNKDKNPNNSATKSSFNGKLAIWIDHVEPMPLINLASIYQEKLGDDNCKIYIINRNQPDFLAQLDEIKSKSAFEILDQWDPIVAQNKIFEFQPDFIIPLFDAMPVNLGNLINHLNDLPQESQVFCFENPDKKAKKTSPANLFKYFWVPLLSPIKEPHIFNRVLVLRPEVLGKILNDFDFNKVDEVFDWSYKISLAGFEITSISSLPFKNESIAESIKIAQAENIFSKLIKYPINWFFKIPIKGIKNGTLFRDPSGQNNPLWRFSFFCLFILAAFLLPFLSFDYGITWDEKIQDAYSKDVLNYFLSFGTDKTCLDIKVPLYNTMIYYGSSFDLLAAFFQKLFPAVDPFELRHILNSLFGLAAMLFCGLAAKEIGGWRMGFLAFIFILLTPSFFGHSMNNPKDIPFALSYIFAIYYLIKFLKELPNPNRGTSFWLVFSIAFSISIRIGGLLIIAFLALFMAVHFINSLIKNKNFNLLKNFGLYFFQFIKIAVPGYFLGLIFWPYALQNPIKNPFIALKNFSNFELLTTYELFDGQRILMKELPWNYIPTLMGFSIPIAILFGFLAAILLISFLHKKYTNWYFLILAGFTLIFPIAYAVYKDSMLYNGWRHFLFVYPSLVIIASAGWDMLWNIFSKPRFRLIPAIILIAAFAGPIQWMFKSHPNQYIYFNELCGGIKGAYGRFELDYYSNSLKQAADWLSVNIPAREKGYSIVTNNEPLTSEHFIKKWDTNSKVIWTREYELFRLPADYGFFTTRTMTAKQLKSGIWPPKNTIYSVEIDGVPIVSVVDLRNNYNAIAYSFYDKNQFDSAIYYFDLAIKDDPGNEESWRMKGLCIIGKDLYDEAKSPILKSMDLIDDNYMAYDYLGIIYANKKQYDSAQIWFEKAIVHKLNFTGAYYHLGVVHYNKAKYQEAINTINKAIKWGGEKSDFYLYLGKSYQALKEYNKAIKAYEKAIKIEPTFADPYVGLAQSYYENGRQDIADKVYEQYLKLTGQTK